MPTKSQAQAQNIAAQFNAATPLLWVNSKEEARVELSLINAAKAAKSITYFWDCGQGGTDITGKPVPGTEQFRDAGSILSAIADRARTGAREVWVLRDLHKWTDGPAGVFVLRQLRNLARQLPNSGVRLVALVPGAPVPPDLSGGDAVVVDWPLPDREELGQMIDTAMANATRSFGDKVEPLNGNRDAAIDAAIGLSGPEAEACFATSIVLARKIDPNIITREKKSIIAKSGVLEWLEPLKGGLDSVGGLDGVKSWFARRACAFTAEARAFGLPALKGVLLVGISGCGKSYTPKALATEWRCPLVRFDFGALKGKFVGESENNIRNAQRTIDSLGPCIVLVDEIEKALAGATQGASDGGVSADALGTFLSWMNDRTSQAFVVATANDISSITNNAPELLRKGRFDEIFFVDTPNRIERIEVLKATLRNYPQHANAALDYDTLADETADFTGAELASLIPDALFAAFSDGKRALTTDDVLAAAGGVVKLTDTAKEKVKELRNWAATRARSATTTRDTERTASAGRVVSL